MTRNEGGFFHLLDGDDAGAPAVQQSFSASSKCETPLTLQYDVRDIARQLVAGIPVSDIHIQIDTYKVKPLSELIVGHPDGLSYKQFKDKLLDAPEMENREFIFVFEPDGSDAEQILSDTVIVGRQWPSNRVQQRGIGGFYLNFEGVAKHDAITFVTMTKAKPEIQDDGSIHIIQSEGGYRTVRPCDNIDLSPLAELNKKARSSAPKNQC